MNLRFHIQGSHNSVAVFTEKILHVGEITELKPMLFESQLLISYVVIFVMEHLFDFFFYRF